jgi:anti-sigma regulatory factor (Ser/Thr protein kinase)
MSTDIRVTIAADSDMLPARAEGRALADRLGFSRTDATLIATAISEIARNILLHAGSGEMILTPVHEDDRYGVTVVARDDGPGIRDVNAVIEKGYSGINGGSGLGLPGARRLMDEFDIVSRLGEGTIVTMRKWRTRDKLEQLREQRRNGE